MGTNYYVKLGDEELHIGKKSCGWKFLFQRYPEKLLQNFEDWTALLALNKIYNEYGEVVDFADFINMVNCSRNNTKEKSHADIKNLDVTVINGYEFTSHNFC